MTRTLITGCSTGIGRALAVGLSAAGHEVIATARSVAQIDDLEVAQCLPLDVTDEASVRAVAREVGSVDVVVNNAGVSVWGPVETTALDQVDRILATNVVGAVRMIQAFVPGMRRRGRGTVVNVSSIAALRVGGPMLAWYAASKRALETISESLRSELSGSGVRVVIVVPGRIESDLGVNRVVSGVDSEPYSSIGSRFVADAARWRTVEFPPSVVVDCILAALAHPDPPLRWAASPDVEAVVAGRTDELEIELEKVWRDPPG